MKTSISLEHNAVIQALSTFSVHISIVKIHHEALLYDETTLEKEYQFALGALLSAYQSLPVYEMLYSLIQTKKLDANEEPIIENYIYFRDELIEYIEPYLQTH